MVQEAAMTGALLLGLASGIALTCGGVWLVARSIPPIKKRKIRRGPR